MRFAPLTAFVFSACTLACQATNSAQRTPAAGGTAASPVPTVAATTPPAQQQPQPPSDGARRITVEELRQAVEKKEVVVVDVRGEATYKAGHIKDARWIPVNDVAQRSGELPRDKTIVTYCS